MDFLIYKEGAMGDLYIMHYGVGHDKGGHSGRYPWGSGKNPKNDAAVLKSKMRENISRGEEINKLAATRTKRRLVIDTKLEKSKDWASEKNRETIEEAIRMRYSTDYVFRKAIKEAKAKWKEVEKENKDLAESFLNYYSDSDFNGDKNQIDKATLKFIEDNKKKPSDYTQLDDVDFAIQILFDEQMATNKKNISKENKAKAKEVASKTYKGTKKVVKTGAKAVKVGYKAAEIASTLSRFI